MDIIESQLAPVTKVSNTWMTNNIDNIVSRYIRPWLEIPVNGTLNIVTQSKRKFGLGMILPSTRHTQCQVTFRNKLRKSGNHNIREIHKSTRNINIQYDQLNSTREALKHIRLHNEEVNHTKPSCKIRMGVRRW